MAAAAVTALHKAQVAAATVRTTILLKIVKVVVLAAQAATTVVATAVAMFLRARVAAVTNSSNLRLFKRCSTPLT